MLFVAAAVIVGAVVPQEDRTPPEEMEAWRTARPALSAVAGALDLDEVHTSWWFVGGLALFVMSVSAAAWRQAGVVRRLSRGEGAWGEGTAYEGRVEDVVANARSAGYRVIADGTGEVLLARHRWALWSGVALHAGLALALGSAFLVYATQATGAVTMVETESIGPDAEWMTESRGVLASPLVLPWSIRLDAVTTSVSPTGELTGLASDVSLIPAEGGERRRTLSASTPLREDGVRVYQDPRHGPAYFLEIESAGGPVRRERVEILPAEAGGLGSLRLETGDGRVLEVAPAASADGMRVSILEGGTAAAQATLHTGGATSLRGVVVRLVAVAEWTQVVFVRDTGTGALFASFGVIALAALALYVVTPSMLRVWEVEGGVRVARKCAHRALSAEDDPIRRVLRPRGGGGIDE